MKTSNSATVQIIGSGRRLSSRAREAITAFADGLAGSVPTADSCRGMILADDGGLSAHRPHSPGHWQAGSRIADDSAAQLRKELARLPRGRKLLRAGAGRSVVTRLSLPAATRDVLAQVVRNKVESLAPWPISEVLWGHRIAGSPQAGQIIVDVGIVSRKTAAGLLEKFDAAGVRISRFEVSHGNEASDGIEIDVHGEARRQTMRGRVKAVMSAVLVSALAVGGYGGYLSYQTAIEMAAVDDDIAKAQLALRNKGGAGDDSQQLTAANILYSRKRETRPAIEVLNTLTKLVPDGIWLSVLEIDGKTITIAGRGNEVPGVIETLESSDTFSAVNFASATQRETDAATDSFSISAVVDAKGPEQ